MRKLAIFGVLAFVMIFYPQHAQAQDQIFTVFACIPGSCVDSVGPVSQGIATVIANAECSTGISLNEQVLSVIGSRGPCLSLYFANADAQRVREQSVDICGIGYFLDKLQMNGSISFIPGIPEFDELVEFGCDGTESGPITDGEVPC
jgi:hypothetical protein